jgi:hypothetical protein
MAVLLVAVGFQQAEELLVVRQLQGEVKLVPRVQAVPRPAEVARVLEQSLWELMNPANDKPELPPQAQEQRR